MDLGEAFGAHARKLGLEPQREKILSLENISGEIKTIRTKKHEYQAKALILAFGAEHRKLDIPGEDDLSALVFPTALPVTELFIRIGPQW